jgi:hypothetical protein
MSVLTAEGLSVPLYSDLQSATPLQGGNETRPHAPSTGKPASGHGAVWEVAWSGPSKTMVGDWKPAVLRMCNLAAAAGLAVAAYRWQVIEHVATARPVTPLRIVPDEQVEHADWMEYTYPWTLQNAVGFYAGEMDWPEIDMEY